MASARPQWHLLQVSDALDEELSTALAASVDLTGWQPQSGLLTALLPSPPAPATRSTDGSYILRSFPVLRGYARTPTWLYDHLTARLAALLLRHTPAPRETTLVCTIPYFAGVAERWPGPVVYWLTDMIVHYASARGIDVPALDRRMAAAATLVCPNSTRLADYLTAQHCDPGKILVLPNATRAQNLLAAPSLAPEPLPADAAGAGRPVAGIIGNLAGNMDWLLLETVVRATPWLTWLFVGPVTMAIPDAAHRQARQVVQELPNTRFVGKKPYGALAGYARSFDVAILPYLRCEPTYSGSSTRFYEHLAAGRPMLSTHGLEELLHKPPLLQLVHDAPEMIAALNHLSANHFDDGHAETRWNASQDGTWQSRATAMRHALAARLAGQPASSFEPSEHEFRTA